MKRTAVIMITFVLLFAVAAPVAAQIDLNLDYPEFFGIDLATEEGQSLQNIIAWFYAFIVVISGLVAFAVIVYGGIRWMTSAGSPTLAADAKDRIQQALLGLLLILSSFVILQTINPDLRSLTIPGLVEEPGEPKVEAPSNTLFFTANGSDLERAEDEDGENHAAFLASSQTSFQLEWRISGNDVVCVGQSNSSGLWNGVKWEPGDSETKFEEIGPLKEGVYAFILQCGEQWRGVQVEVSD